MTLRDLQKQAHALACDKGWWDNQKDSEYARAASIALMHSELSEVLEAIRKPDMRDKHLPHLDPVAVELADVVIRILDFCEGYGLDLEQAVMEKMAYNRGREKHHGGKAI